MTDKTADYDGQFICKTLKGCKQDVFEDGPKRDCRIWLGDLRLQARANYYTFKNYDLTKCCMYIFAQPFSKNSIWKNKTSCYNALKPLQRVVDKNRR